MRIPYATLLLALTYSLPASGQAVISERIAIEFIEGKLGYACMRIPVGIHKTAAVPLMSNAEKALARSALKFQELGIVTVKSVGNLMENTMTVELRDDFDRSNLLDPNNMKRPCLLEARSMKVTKVQRIDSAQGGTTIKWNASLVYVLYERTPNPLAEQYRKLMGASSSYGKKKGVFLFRQDPFDKGWTLRSSDSADQNSGNFEPRNAANGLRAD